MSVCVCRCLRVAGADLTSVHRKHTNAFPYTDPLSCKTFFFFATYTTLHRILEYESTHFVFMTLLEFDLENINTQNGLAHAGTHHRHTPITGRIQRNDFFLPIVTSLNPKLNENVYAAKPLMWDDIVAMIYSFVDEFMTSHSGFSFGRKKIRHPIY